MVAMLSAVALTILSKRWSCKLKWTLYNGNWNRFVYSYNCIVPTCRTNNVVIGKDHNSATRHSARQMKKQLLYGLLTYLVIYSCLMWRRKYNKNWKSAYYTYFWNRLTLRCVCLHSTPYKITYTRSQTYGFVIISNITSSDRCFNRVEYNYR